MAACEATINAAIGLSLGAGGLLLGPLGPHGVFMLAGAMGALATVLAFRLPGDSSPIAPFREQVRPDADQPRRQNQLRALPSGAWTAPPETA